MLTGDSFTEGACVKPNDTISAVLRQLNLNVINVRKESVLIIKCKQEVLMNQ